MRVLFLTQVLPYPLDAGPKVRAYYVLRHLAQDHAVTLISFVRPTDTPAAVDHLKQFCQDVHTVPMLRSRSRDAGHLLKSLATHRPFIIARDWAPAMAELLAEVVKHTTFDAIHADQLWMAPYARLAQRLAGNGVSPLTVLDQHNAVFMIPGRLAAGEKNPFKRALLNLETRKLATYEVDACRRFDRVVWVTRDDYDAVRRVAASAEASIPNSGVIPICADPQQEAPIRRQPGARRVTFLGGLHYPPNAQGVLWFARHVFPTVLRQMPDAILTVIGKQPPEALHSLGIPPANLAVTGYLDDPRPYLAETGAFIVPLLAGGGMRVKIVDAWTWGLPIVSTAVGAEGIDICPGENLLLADTPEDFAHATVQLLQNANLARRIADNGRRWVEQRYGWRTAYQAWERVYSVSAV